MVWTIEWEERALKELKKLGKTTQRNIVRYFRDRIVPNNDPRCFGKGLTGNKSGLWRYRVGNHRMVCKIQDHNLIILVIRVAHRRHVYQ